MNTLTDLRSTLDRHAEDAALAPGTPRTVAVHHRVAAERRRRRAVGVAGLGLALVVAVTAVVSDIGRTPFQPAAPVVLGQRAPATMTSLGYTYRATGTVTTIAGHGAVVVKAEPQPRLVSWTTDGPATVTFRTPDDEVIRSRQTGFHDFVFLGPDVSGKLTVSVDHGQVGLADYALTATAPAGYTKAGLTFRDTVAETPLVSAAIGDLGETELRTSFTAPGGQVSVHAFCSGLPKGASLHVSFNGDGAVSSSGCGAADFDPGASSTYQIAGGKPGSTVAVRAWLTSGIRSNEQLPTGSVPGLRLGFGIYGPVGSRPLAGYRVPSFVEHAGHTWQLVRRIGSGSGAVHVPAAGYPRVAEVAYSTAKGRTQVRFQVTGQTDAGAGGVGGQASIGDLWVPAGARGTATLQRGTGRIGVALYRQIEGSQPFLASCEFCSAPGS